MEALEEMHSLGLLTKTQFLELRAWFESPLSVEAISLEIPEELLVALFKAHLLIEMDEDSETMH
jgi:hypothetical protein